MNELRLNIPSTRGHTETGPRFGVSPERPEKRGIDLEIPWMVVHYTTAAPGRLWWGIDNEDEIIHGLVKNHYMGPVFQSSRAIIWSQQNR